MKNWHVILLIAVLFITAGCSKPPQPAFRVGMVVVGELEDHSFNHSAHIGLVKAMQELGCDIKILEAKSPSEYETHLDTLASGKYDLVIAVGYLLSDSLAKVAPRYPDIKFSIIDGTTPDIPNVSVYRFREEEGSYLAGVMAGTVSRNKKVGFIGGTRTPLIERFEAGYMAGVRTASPDTTVLVDYTNCFDNPDSGKELAVKQLDQGADVIYHASGACGSGIISSVWEKGRGYYAIGVDSDQDYMAPGQVLTSMIKRVDTAVFDSIKSVKEGRFTPGVTTLGLKEDGIDLSPMTYTKSTIVAMKPQLLTEINTLKILIKTGKIQVPDTLVKLQEFNLPKDTEWR